MSLKIARISGVSIPLDKKLYISLSYIYGVGVNNSLVICNKIGLDSNIRVKDLTEDDLAKIRKYIEENLLVEGDLRAKVASDVKMKISIGSYQGSRHRFRLPVHGQRTKTNAKTRKGRSRAIANKKKPTK